MAPAKEFPEFPAAGDCQDMNELDVCQIWVLPLKEEKVLLVIFFPFSYCLEFRHDGRS